MIAIDAIYIILCKISNFQEKNLSDFKETGKYKP